MSLILFAKDPLYSTALTFDVVTEDELNAFRGSLPKGNRFISKGYKGVYPQGADGPFVPFDEKVVKGSEESSTNKVKQPPYNFASVQVELFLDVNTTYYLVPSLYKRNQAGTFYFQVMGDGNFELGTSENVRITEQVMKIGNSKANEKELKMTVAQFYAKKEQLRERIVSEIKRLKLSMTQICSVFDTLKKSNKGNHCAVYFYFLVSLS